MLDSLSNQTVKNQILDAAGAIVAEKGAAHLTFDALVKKTDMSKGGILYHYKNKNALLQAMMDRMIVAFEQHREQIKKVDTTSVLPDAKTYILAAHSKSAKDYNRDLGVLAAAANNPELLEPMREHYRKNSAQSRTNKKMMGLNTLLYLAIDGYWLLSALGLNFITKEQKEEMLKTAQKLAEDGKL
jgi:AcrR family transcriptional regulator